MYFDSMIKICKAENGFVVECCVPFKPEKKGEAKNVVSDYPGSSEKKYIAKDAIEVAGLIQRLMPLLDEDYKSEEDFDTAFDKAAGEMEKKGADD